MSQNGKSRLPAILAKYDADLLAEWVKDQAADAGTRRSGTLREAELRDQCREFLGLAKEAMHDGTVGDIQEPRWNRLREMLSNLSRSRALQGFSPSETASFVFSLKRPLFARLRQELTGDGPALAAATWTSTELLDRLGLFTTEVQQKARERSSRGSSRKCSSCPRRWSSSGRGSSPCP